MATLLEEAMNAGKSDVSTMPKFLPLSTAQKMSTVSSANQKRNVPNYKAGFAEKLRNGIEYGVAQATELAPALQLYGEEIQLGLGGYFGADESFVSRKKLNIATLQRNIAYQQRNKAENYSNDTLNSMPFKIGAAIPNFAMMAGVAMATQGVGLSLGLSAGAATTAGGTAGILSAIPAENVEQQSDRIKFDEKGNVDVSKITPEWARKTAGGEAFYMVGMGILEAKFGLFKNLSQWQKPIPFKVNFLKNLSVPTTTALKSFINEGSTEGLQSLLSSGIQLAEGNITMAEMPERIKQAWEEAVIGGILGGSVGVAVGINQAHNVKTMLTEEVSKVVTDPEECEKIVDAIYDSGTAEMTNVISKELELSSELNTKHGAIYDTMQGAIYDAINNSGAFTDVNEAEIAQYVSETSKMFANQVLAEANKRGVLIDDVLKASDIKFENGKIYMKAGKEVIAESSVTEENHAEMNVNEQGEEAPEVINQSKESDYSRRKKDVAYSILAEITGKSKKWLRSQLGSSSKKRGMIKRRETIELLIRNAEDKMAAKDGLIPEWQEFYTYNKGELNADYELGMRVYADIINDNFEEPDSIIQRYYDNEADNIEGLFQSIREKAEQAQTLEDLGAIIDNEKDNLPSYFQDYFIYEEIEKIYAINIERLLNGQGKNIGYNEENAGKTSGINNRTTQTSDIWSNKTSNDKSFEQNQEIDDDLLFQSAYHGTPHNFDEFSLDAIGTGEGAQAHGWGLYFAENKEISDNYREKLTNYKKRNNIQSLDDEYDYLLIDGKPILENYKIDIDRTVYNYIHAPIVTPSWINTTKTFLQEKIDEWTKLSKDKEYPFKDYAKEKVDAYTRLLTDISNGATITEKAEGQLFKVDIPENDVLLDEDKKLNEQPEKVQKILKELLKPVENFADFKGIIANNNIDIEKTFGTKYLQNAFDTYSNNPDKYIDIIYGNLTGKEIYKKLGGNKQASLLLNQHGIKGITYDGRQDGRCYVIFDDKAVSILNKLYQLKNTPKQPKIFKGAFDYSIKAIELFKDADYSTLPHELAHYWLDNMWSYYRSGKASEAYTNNFQGVLDWLGVKEGQINLTRAQQEKFARGYEKYLLNGYAPSGLIQGAFDDYDKWLQKVYNDARALKVKLTPDAIQFFDSMTTGELLDYDVPETQAEIREKNIEQMNKDIETARKFVVEKQSEYNNFDGGNAITKETVPVTTEGEKKQSKAYTNQASILGIAEELNYNKTDIAEQNKLASDFVRNNLDEARQVVNGEKEAPSNILKNAIYNAYLKEMLAIGDNEAYVNALKNQSLELTRAGQEIASQRGAIENIFDSGYWIRRIENLKKTKLANQKFGNGVTASEQEQALSKMNDFIKNKVEAVMSDFMEAEPEQQKKIAEKLSKDIAAEFKVKPDTKLYQSMYEPSEVRTRTNAYNYIYRYINSALGLDLTKAQYNEIIAKTTAIQKSIETTRNRNGNPSALFFKNISEMENYANSIEPSPALAILTSTVGRGNMLFSPKTIALNIESNIVNFFTEAITRRIQNGAVNMAVDPQVIKDYLAYSREVFNTSGYQVSSMPTLDPTTQILSEKMTTTGGDRVVDKLGRFFEQTIFKYGLGAPDLFFKDMTFVDTANVLATKEAKGDSKKATELFKDICLIEPKTAKGKELREIAINEALIATYQNKGKTSDLALGIRNAINKATGSANVGDMLSPFVKTPANVIGLGFDYSMGGLYALKNIQTIYNDIQNGTFTETTRTAMRSLARNGIGFVAAMLIASLIDDDDYIPEYALLDAKERELVKMKGGVFNSIKIGDKYISLDYFGPLAMPLVSYLNARRGKDVKNKIWNYFQGSAYQALKLPVIGDIKSLLEGTGRTLTKDADENIKMATEAAIDFVSSRSIPAIVTDIAKMTDEFERETNNDAMNRLKSKVPVLREELPMQYNYGTGQPRLTQNPISQLFAGARIKEEVSSPVIREIDRLDKSNVEDKVNISKVTKLDKLSTLNDSQKIEVEKKFAQRYANAVDGLLQTNYYNSLDDGGKVKAINKIKDNIRNDLKVEYGLEAPPKPKRRKGRKRRRSRR